MSLLGQTSFADSSYGFTSLSSGSLQSSSSDTSLRDGFMDSDHRAGGPNLCDLPGKTWPLSFADARWTKLYDNHDTITRNTLTTLRKFDIKSESKDLNFVYRESIFEPEVPGLPTFLILVEGENSEERWRKAAREIHRELRQLYELTINVEILWDRLMKIPNSSPVLKTDQIHPKWEHISNQIFDRIPHDEWTGLACYRWGISDDPNQNPPTILIAIGKTVSKYRKWDNELKEVKRILEDNGIFDTETHIMKDKLQRGQGLRARTIELEPYHLKTAVQPGVSVGVRDNDRAVGTFAGIIELRQPDDAQWEQYGLTCFHCVYMPPLQSCPPNTYGVQKCFNTRKTSDNIEYRHWYRSPICERPASASLLKVDQPSVRDLKAMIAHLTDKIATDEANPDYQAMETKLARGDTVLPQRKAEHIEEKQLISIDRADRDMYSAFLASNNHHLGHVVAGSDFIRAGQAHSRPNSRWPSLFDWALIKVKPGRMGTNVISTEHTRGNFRRRPVKLKEPRWPEPDEVYKLGRTTGVTHGRPQGLAPIFMTEYLTQDGNYEVIKTTEHVVHGKGDNLSDEGDSGSLIFSENGHVYGMLFGVARASQVSAFMAIGDLYEDIKQITGAEEVRLLPQPLPEE